MPNQPQNNYNNPNVGLLLLMVMFNNNHNPGVGLLTLRGGRVVNPEVVVNSGLNNNPAPGLLTRGGGGS